MTFATFSVRGGILRHRRARGIFWTKSRPAGNNHCLSSRLSSTNPVASAAMPKRTVATNSRAGDPSPRNWFSVYPVADPTVRAKAPRQARSANSRLPFSPTQPASLLRNRNREKRRVSQHERGG